MLPDRLSEPVVNGVAPDGDEKAFRWDECVDQWMNSNKHVCDNGVLWAAYASGLPRSVALSKLLQKVRGASLSGEVAETIGHYFESLGQTPKSIQKATGNRQ